MNDHPVLLYVVFAVLAALAAVRRLGYVPALGTGSWRRVAAALGLEASRNSSGPMVSGNLRGAFVIARVIEVTVGRREHRHVRRFTRVSAMPQGKVHPALRTPHELFATERTSPHEKPRMAELVEARLRGGASSSTEAVLALLNDEAKQAIGGIGGEWRISEDGLEVEWPVLLSGSRLEQALAAAATIAEQLTPDEEDLVQRLAESAEAEPNLVLKRELAEALLDSFPKHERTRRVAQALASSPDEALRLRAAAVLRGEGWQAS
ncbi:MAG: hypothetical protein HYV63_12085 [Candidatus Schekmanbacteria bacterium]|nr:hypothetical protein [Candidatus Schekmanbacteria bacterium]